MGKTSLTRIAIIFGVFAVLILAFISLVFEPQYYLQHPLIERQQDAALSEMMSLLGSQMYSLNHDKKYLTSKELERDKRPVEGYKIEISARDDSFQLWATPIEYGRSGRMSYYADSNNIMVVHGADHEGQKAVQDDPIVRKFNDPE